MDLGKVAAEQAEADPPRKKTSCAEDLTLSLTSPLTPSVIASAAMMAFEYGNMQSQSGCATIAKYQGPGGF